MSNFSLTKLILAFCEAQAKVRQGQAKVLFLEESLLHSCAQPVVAAEKAMF